MSSKSENLFKNSNLHKMFGKQAIVILVSIYCLLWLWFKVSPHSVYIYS